jgi:hypothetical protein
LPEFIIAVTDWYSPLKVAMMEKIPSWEPAMYIMKAVMPTCLSGDDAIARSASCRLASDRLWALRPVREPSD